MQLSFENAQLRAQLTEKPGGSPSPALQNLIKVASPARSSSAVVSGVVQSFFQLDVCLPLVLKLALISSGVCVCCPSVFESAVARGRDGRVC